MSKYFYDLHTHSSLSPCADNESTPATLAGLGKLRGLDILALTDHNSLKNCPAFFKAAEAYGIIPVAGVELTSAEDVHVVCLFPTLDTAMAFDEEIQKYRNKILNRPEIFGEQLILNEDDEVTGVEEHLLPFALSLSLEDVPGLVEKYSGVAYPAHIDRDANGIISVLGTFPISPSFTAFELRDKNRAKEYINRYNLQDKRLIISSDAHRLSDFPDEKESFFELFPDGTDDDAVRRALINYLRGEAKI